MNNSKKKFMDCQVLFHWPSKLYIMRTFLNHIKNETFDEIKTSLENVWQRMIQLSEFSQYSITLILKWKCLVGASRVCCGRVVLLQLLYIHDGAVGVTNLGVMLLWDRQPHSEHHPDRVRGLHRPHYCSQTEHSHGIMTGEWHRSGDRQSHTGHHPITLTLPWDDWRPRKGPPGGEKPRKRNSSLSGHWMGHLLSYSLSGGHDGAMLPINPRCLNGLLTSHFIFSSHM